MQKHLNVIRTVTLICIAGKAVSVSFDTLENGMSLPLSLKSSQAAPHHLYPDNTVYRDPDKSS